MFLLQVRVRTKQEQKAGTLPDSSAIWSAVATITLKTTIRPRHSSPSSGTPSTDDDLPTASELRDATSAHTSRDRVIVMRLGRAYAERETNVWPTRAPSMGGSIDNIVPLRVVDLVPGSRSYPTLHFK